MHLSLDPPFRAGGAARPVWKRRPEGRVRIAVVIAATLVGAGGGGALGMCLIGPMTSLMAGLPPAAEIQGIDPITGRHVALSDFAGRPVVINVWGSWCEPCNSEAPALRALAARYPRIQVVGIDYRETEAGARAFYRKWRWRHPSIFDPSGRIALGLGSQRTPTTYFLDARHHVRATAPGASSLRELERGLQAALGAS